MSSLVNPGLSTSNPWHLSKKPSTKLYGHELPKSGAMSYPRGNPQGVKQPSGGAPWLSRVSG